MSLSTTQESSLPLGGPAESRRPVWSWVARLLALTAAAICVYLAWAAIAAGGRVVGCGDGTGGDCTGVLLSRWARWFGLPVAVPAAAVYGVIFVALWVLAGSHDGRRRRVWYILIPLATLVLASAAWFSALQLLVIGKVCWYCLAVHGCAFALAMILLWNVPHELRPRALRERESVGLAPATTLGLVLGGFLGMAVLIAGQVLSKAAAPDVEITTVASSAVEQPRKAEVGGKFPIDLSNYFPATEGELSATKIRPRRISLVGGRAIIDARRTPILGEPDAEIVIVELFDYTCPHCRQTNRFLSEARKRYGAQLAVAALVTPMDPTCNEHVHEPAVEPGSCDLARLAVAIWQTKPAAFAAFHEWLMEGTETRSLEAARARAIEILAEDVLDRAENVLDRALADEAITREIEADNHIYQIAGAGTIPKLLSERLIVSGQPASAEKLFEVLEKQLGLEPQE